MSEEKGVIKPIFVGVATAVISAVLTALILSYLGIQQEPSRHGPSGIPPTSGDSTTTTPLDSTKKRQPPPTETPNPIAPVKEPRPQAYEPCDCAYETRTAKLEDFPRAKPSSWQAFDGDEFKSQTLWSFNAKDIFAGDGSIEVEIKARSFSSSERSPRYGLFLRSDDDEKGFELLVSRHKTFTIYERLHYSTDDPNQSVRKLNSGWQRAEHISELLRESNLLTICRKGDLLAFFVNHKQVFEHRDDSVRYYRMFGIEISRGGKGEFRNLKLCARS